MEYGKVTIEYDRVGWSMREYAGVRWISNEQFKYEVEISQKKFGSIRDYEILF